MRRWLAVIELSADRLVAWGALYYAYSVLSVPMAEGLQLAPEIVAAGFSVALLVSGVAARPVGRLLDRHGARPVLRAGAVIGPLALVTLAIANGPASLFAAFALLGVAHASSLYEPAIRAIVDWFPRAAERGRALLVLTIVGGFASTVFLPLTAVLVDRWGYRCALLSLAGAVAMSAGLVALRIPDSHPTQWSGRHDVAPATPAQRRAQTLLALAFALQSFASTALSVALVWFLVERGASLAGAAALAGLSGAAQVPGRIVLGPLQRKVSVRVRIPLLFGVQAASAAAIASVPSSVLPIAIFAFGMAAGTMTLERPAVLLEWFGAEGFGARSATIAAVSAVARASSPYAIELLRSAFGYPAAFRGLAVVIAAGGAAVLLAGNAVSSVKNVGTTR